MNKKQKDALLAKLVSRIESAENFSSSEFQTYREEALRNYMGEPYQNDTKIGVGNSRYVDKTCAEVVDGALPQLIPMFASSERSHEYRATHYTRNAFADQATEYARMVIFRENDGVDLFDQWFKSALMYRLGVVKVYHEEETRVYRTNYKDLTVEELEGLEVGEDTEVIVVEEREEALPPIQYIADAVSDEPLPKENRTITKYDVETVQRITRPFTRLQVVPLEEFIVDNTATDQNKLEFVAHKRDITRTELLDMGFTPKDISELDFESQPSMDWNTEKTQRILPEGSFFTEAIDESMEKTTIYECYTYADIDGDGRAEYCKILVGGTGGTTILDVEEVDTHPFALLSPTSIPFKLIGKSLIDDTQDLQLMKSQLFRETLNNFYYSNKPRPLIRPNVDESQVADHQPGKPIEVDNPDDVTYITPPSIAGASIQLIELVDAMRESRTGVTKYNQGLNSDSLNKTAHGIETIKEMSLSKIELIARRFADTGVKRLYKLILKQMVKHRPAAAVIAMQGEYVEVDPRNFSEDFWVESRLALGSGNKEKELAVLNQYIMLAEKIMSAQGGMEGALINSNNLYKMLIDMGTAGGVPQPKLYWVDPASPEGQAAKELQEQKAQEQGAQPSPEAALAEAQIKVAELNAQTKMEETRAKIELDVMKFEFEKAIEIARMEKEYAIKEAELELKYKTQIQLPVAQMAAAEMKGTTNV